MTSWLRKWLLASPPGEWVLQQLRELLIGAVRQGPVPRHVAFVMDGNRRYARSHRIETVEGHHMGFEALARVLDVCFRVGMTHVTIYAFSIENFKRSRYEVDGLMEMAKVRLIQLSQHGNLMDRYGVCIRVLGDRELVRPDVLAAADKAVDMTRGNGSAVLNVCFPYTSRNEITTAIRETVIEWNQVPEDEPKSDLLEAKPTLPRMLDHDEHSPHNVRPYPNTTKPIVSPSSSRTSSSSNDDSTNNNSPSSRSSTTTIQQPSPPPTGLETLKQGLISDDIPQPTTSPAATPGSYPSPEHITSSNLTSHMFTADNPPLDLLIRTSGVHRLSDFMLWQCHQHTEIAFLEVLWPEFDLWSFLPILWEWQRRQQKNTPTRTPGAGEYGRARLGKRSGYPTFPAGRASLAD